VLLSQFKVRKTGVPEEAAHRSCGTLCLKQKTAEKRFFASEQFDVIT